MGILRVMHKIDAGGGAVVFADCVDGFGIVVAAKILGKDRVLARIDRALAIAKA